MIANKLNILYIFADQLSIRALSIFGDKNNNLTPNIDELAKRGVRFENSYCSTPQCSPSRSSLLTGLYPHKTKVIGNIGTINTKELNKQFYTIGDFFKDRKFETAYFGKWHLGSHALDFGFKHEFIIDYEKLVSKNDEKYFNKDQCTTDELLKFIDCNKYKNWMAMVSYDNPHDIYYVKNMMKKEFNLCTKDIKLPDSFNDELLDKPKVQREYRDLDQGHPLKEFTKKQWEYYIAFYYYLIRKIDEQIGRIIDKLKEHDLFDDTIIVFSSDHGDLMGAHKCPYKGPMMYDELIKIPLIFSCPKILPQNQLRKQLTLNTDIFPTLCDLLGFDIPKGVDGKSLKPYFIENEKNSRDYVIVQYYSKQKWVNPIRTITDAVWKYNLYLDGQDELYNLKDDKSEMKNLSNISKYEPIKNELRNRLIDWIKKENDPFFNYQTTKLEKKYKK